MLVLVYVNDMTVAGKSIEKVQGFKMALSREFEISDLGELKYILGIQIMRNREVRTISMNQTAYIHQILAYFGMSECAPVSTLLTIKHNLSTSQSPKTEEEVTKYLKYANGLHYLEIVGALLYATQTHLDIQYAVSIVSQFDGNPGKPHLEAAKHVLCYLKGTADLRLTLECSGSKSVDLIGWTDSNWAQDANSRRSISGFFFEIASGSVSWSAKKQLIIALSTVEAEYMVATNAMKEAIWLQVLLEDLGYPQTNATIIHADNQDCITLTCNPVTHTHAKHIDIRHHFIRERVKNKEINLQYCSTKDMIADIFTKQLLWEAFKCFRSALGINKI